MNTDEHRFFVKNKAWLLFFFLFVSPMFCMAAPKAVWATTRVEAGELAEDAEGRFVLNVRNAGDEALVLRVGAVCCGISLTLPPALEAGQEGEVALVLRMKGQVGRLSRIVRVATNDPGQPEVLIRVTGMVTPSGKTVEVKQEEAPPASGLRVLPQTLVLDGEEKSGVVLLRAADQRAFEVTATRLLGGAGKVSTKRVTATVWQVKLEEVALDEEEGWVEVETTHPDGKVLQINITALNGRE